MRGALTLLSRLPTRRSGAPRSSILVAVALAGLIAIVAVVAAGHRAGGGHAGKPSRAVVDYLLSAFLVLMLVEAVAAAYFLWRERDELAAQDDPAARRRRMVISLFTFLGVVLMFLLLREAGFRPDRIFHRLSLHHGGGGGGAAATKKGHQGLPAAATEPHFRWIAGAIVLVLVLAVALALVYVGRQAREAAGERRRAAEEVAEALDASVEDLRAERDARRAIVAAYARMERALAAVGIPRLPAEAPLEFMARALEALRASEGSVRRLTELFRLARFSVHPLGAGEKEQAIDALLAIRDEVRSAA
jgi:hypothetical protein